MMNFYAERLDSRQIRYVADGVSWAVKVAYKYWQNEKLNALQLNSGTEEFRIPGRR